MSKRSRKSVSTTQGPKAGQRSQPALFLTPGRIAAGLVVIAVLIIGGGLALNRRESPATSTSAPSTFAPGNVVYCVNRQPPFIQALGFGKNIALDTRAKFVEGVAVRELDDKGNITNTYEHPSWSSAGYLGSYEFDDAGNIYLAPMPFINILDNPPEKANIIYQIDHTTGEMKPLVDLPAAAPLTPQSVYGLTDLAYDCDTHSLYAASVLGSTYDQVAGRIFQIDPASGEIRGTLEGIDAFSLGVFNAAPGKRLYIGMARVPEIYSIPLTNDGRFDGELRLELSLDNMGFHHDERPRALIFQGGDGLVVNMLQFDFNLVAPTETRQTYYEYHYNAPDDTWTLLNSYFVDQ